MVAAVAKVYCLAMSSILQKKVNVLTDTVKVCLLDSSHTPNQDTHQYLTSLSHEITDGSYSRKTLSSKALTLDTGTNTLKFTADDVRFPALTATAVRYAVVFIDTGTPSTSPLLFYIDLGANEDFASEDFLLVVPPTGLLQAVAA